MMNHKRLLWIIVGLVLAGLPLRAADNTHTLSFDGAQRQYDLFVPAAYSPDVPAPLIVALHGVYSTGQALRGLSGLDAYAEALGALVVYPQSLHPYWDDGRYAAGLYPQDGAVDDAGFIAALVDALSQTYTLDPARIYLTGTGNGGGLAYRLACLMPERWAAVAVVSGGMWDFHRETCTTEPTGPLNLLILQGAADPVNLLAGRDFTADYSAANRPLRLLGSEEVVLFWVERYGCATTRTRLDDAAQVVEFADCPDGTRIALNIVRGAGSNWMRRAPDHRLNQFGVDASAIITAFFADPTGDDWVQQAVPDHDFAGEARSYIAYVPASYDPAVPLPLVLILHGRPGTSTGIAYITDMHLVAAKHGFIAVYPDGINREWNYPRSLIEYGTNDRDDVQFLRDLIHDLSLDFAIDPARIYVTGFSNGGFMTQRLACEAPDQFAAFGVVGATAFWGMQVICGRTPVPIMFIHGTHDVSIPFAGDKRAVMGRVIPFLASMAETLTFWAAVNGCDLDVSEPEDVPAAHPDNPTRVKIYTVPNCPAGIGLKLYAIQNGGHNWPGVDGATRIGAEIAGETNMDINAGEVIWEFFTHYTREVPAP